MCALSVSDCQSPVKHMLCFNIIKLHWPLQECRMSREAPPNNHQLSLSDFTSRVPGYLEDHRHLSDMCQYFSDAASY